MKYITKTIFKSNRTFFKNKEIEGYIPLYKGDNIMYDCYNSLGTTSTVSGIITKITKYIETKDDSDNKNNRLFTNNSYNIITIFVEISCDNNCIRLEKEEKYKNNNKINKLKLD